MSTKEKMGSLENFLRSISLYNEHAMAGKVSQATAKKMNTALKKMWKKTLQFALERGESISDLETPLKNYQAGTNKFIVRTQKVVTESIEIASKIVSTISSWFSWFLGCVQKVVKTIVQYIPIVREIVTFVEEKIINPLYEAAQKVFEATGIKSLYTKFTGWVKSLTIFVLSIPFLIVILVKDTLRYWWQGRGDIERNHVWGNFEFDIIDVERHPEGISRHQMGRREALQRVWCSSWLQYWLDPSYRLGLDLDEREHVQHRQQLAHQDYLRSEKRQQKAKAMFWAVIGVVVGCVMLVGTILTGGAAAVVLVAWIALIGAILNALLQAASMSLDSNRSLEQEQKDMIESIITVLQFVVVIASLATACLGFGLQNVATEVEIVLISGARFAGRILKEIATWVQKLTQAVRLKERFTGILQQVDRMLRAVGIGGSSVIVMDVKGGDLGLAASVAETASSGIQLQDTVRNNIKSVKNATKSKTKQKADHNKAGVQQQDEEEPCDGNENDEDDDTDHKNKYSAEVSTKTTKTTLMCKDGSTMTKTKVFTCLTTTEKRGERYRVTGDNTIHQQISNEGTRTITEENFNESSLTATSSETIESTTLWKEGVISMKECTHTKKWCEGTTLKGEVTVSHIHGGVTMITIQPAGHPTPKSKVLTLTPGDRSTLKSLEGEMSKDHFCLLCKVLSVDPEKSLEPLKVLIAKNPQDLEIAACEAATMQLLHNLFPCESVTAAEKDRFLTLYRAEAKKHGHSKALLHACHQAVIHHNNAVADSTPAVELLYNHMVKSHADFCRQKVIFRPLRNDPIKLSENDLSLPASRFIKTMCTHMETRDVHMASMHRITSSNEIKHTVEKFVREGDKQGLESYVKNFLNYNIPAGFAEFSEEYQKVFDHEAREIVSQLLEVVKTAWGQESDEAVTHRYRTHRDSHRRYSHR
eukprot:PhF_6_TR1974/c0_g1_i1/m.3273